MSSKYSAMGRVSVLPGQPAVATATWREGQIFGAAFFSSWGVWGIGARLILNDCEGCEPASELRSLLEALKSHKQQRRVKVVSSNRGVLATLHSWVDGSDEMPDWHAAIGHHRAQGNARSMNMLRQRMLGQVSRYSFEEVSRRHPRHLQGAATSLAAHGAQALAQRRSCGKHALTTRNEADAIADEWYDTMLTPQRELGKLAIALS